METPLRPLPRGRHRLPRAEVVSSQRSRMLLGMAEAMMERGYADTTVADVIRRAGVSRETFYQQFSSKADCFMSAFDAAAELLLGTIEQVGALDLGALTATDGHETDGHGADGHGADGRRVHQHRPHGHETDGHETQGHETDGHETDGHQTDGHETDARIDQFDRALGIYLDTLADNAPAARLFLVEVYAAGPEAVRRRVALQRRIVDGVAGILGVAADDEAGRFACDVLVNAIASMVTEPLVSPEPERLRDLREPIVALVRRAAELTR